MNDKTQQFSGDYLTFQAIYIFVVVVVVIFFFFTQYHHLIALLKTEEIIQFTIMATRHQETTRLIREATSTVINN